MDYTEYIEKGIEKAETVTKIFEVDVLSQYDLKILRRLKKMEMPLFKDIDDIFLQSLFWRDAEVKPVYSKNRIRYIDYFNDVPLTIKAGDCKLYYHTRYYLLGRNNNLDSIDCFEACLKDSGFLEIQELSRKKSILIL